MDAVDAVGPVETKKYPSKGGPKDYGFGPCLQEGCGKWIKLNSATHKFCDECRSKRKKGQARTASRNWNKMNKEQRKEFDRKRQLAKYGLTQEDYDRMLEEQGFACAICGVMVATVLDVDHCHQTGVNRGLLCQKCNKAIGLMNDDIYVLHAAIKYLERSKDV